MTQHSDFQMEHQLYPQLESQLLKQMVQLVRLALWPLLHAAASFAHPQVLLGLLQPKVQLVVQLVVLVVLEVATVLVAANPAHEPQLLLLPLPCDLVWDQVAPRQQHICPSSCLLQMFAEPPLNLSDLQQQLYRLHLGHLALAWSGAPFQGQVVHLDAHHVQ